MRFNLRCDPNYYFTSWVSSIFHRKWERSCHSCVYCYEWKGILATTSHTSHTCTHRTVVTPLPFFTKLSLNMWYKYFSFFGLWKVQPTSFRRQQKWVHPAKNNFGSVEIFLFFCSFFKQSSNDKSIGWNLSPLWAKIEILFKKLNWKYSKLI